MEDKLIINNQPVSLDASFSLRWVEQEDGEAYPVLYQNGKRIVKAWNINIQFASPEDPFGGNANTN